MIFRPLGLLLVSIIVVAHLVTLPVHASGAGDDTAMTDSETIRANEFFEDAFKERLARSPMFLARLGIKEQYDKWDDISEEFLAETNEIIARQLADLKREIDFELLDEEARLSCRLFVNEAEQLIKNYEYRLDSYPVNQM